MNHAAKLDRVARSDTTFRRQGALWVGKCLICNGPLAFDAGTGEGASLEHIRAKTRGGGEDLENLGLVHSACNHEKGRRWDPRRRRNEADYEAFIQRLIERRLQRWRAPDEAANSAPSS